MRCQEMQLFFTTRDHGSQGPEFCTPMVLFRGVMGVNNVIIGNN